MLNNLAALLDRNSEFSGEGEDMVTENEERLFDVPIMMLTDINQQVSPWVESITMFCNSTCIVAYVY